MTTHSPSFPPDHYILAVQVRTVVHPLLQKRSSLVSPLLKGVSHELRVIQSGFRASRWSISTCVFLWQSLLIWRLFSPCVLAKQVSSSANSACHFRNDRLDDDTLLGTTGCTLNDQFYIFRGRVWGFAMKCRVRKNRQVAFTYCSDFLNIFPDRLSLLLNTTVHLPFAQVDGSTCINPPVATRAALRT